MLSVADSSLAAGKPGVGTNSCNELDSYGIGETTFRYIDTQPPSVPPTPTAAAYPTRVNLSWTASTDNVATTGYKVYRDSAYIGSSPTNSYSDVTVSPATNYNYTVLAYDAAGNESAQSSPPRAVTTPGTSYSAPDLGGPVEYATTWGAGPEKIALLTGALSVRLPLFKLQHRTRGPGFAMAASWNSQFWTWDNTGTRMLALDTGYGLGFNFIVAGIYPVYNGSQLDRFDLIDSAGVIHKLIYTGTPNQYKSKDSTYLLWDNATRKLTFTDGTMWLFDCYSRDPEPDAGTRYPTQLKDSNGNLIDITYEPASGLPGTNSSARIRTIRDTLTTYTWEYTTINGLPHVTRVYHYKVSGEQFNDALFTYQTRSDIVSPFAAGYPGQPLTRVLLTEVSFTGAVGKFLFTYNTSAEITKITFPYKGYFRYDYTTASFGNGARQVREVGTRYMSADGSGGSEQAYTFSHPSGDSGLSLHTQTTLIDPAGHKKVWDFIQGSLGWDTGLNNRQEVWQGPAPNYVLKNRREITWTQDNPASGQPLSNPRMAPP